MYTSVHPSFRQGGKGIFIAWICFSDGGCNILDLKHLLSIVGYGTLDLIAWVM